jgi:hypothetical protein
MLLNRQHLLASIACLTAGCSTSSPNTQEVRRFSSIMTPVVDVMADMSVYLNQQEPLPVGAYTIGDPLPVSEQTVPENAIGSVQFEIDGDEFTMDARFTNLPDANTVTDPLASARVGTRVTGDAWDIWMLSQEPNVVTIQMGMLVADPASPGTYTFHFDSRTGVDFNGEKMSVNNINSMQTTWPGEALSLYDVSFIGMDIEAANGPDEPSGQHRMNDLAPDSRQIDWTSPDP